VPAPSRCPNLACVHHARLARSSYRHRGSYARHDETSVRRFECKACGRHFSEQTFSPSYRAKKPAVDAALAVLRERGVSARAAARLLGLNRKTVIRRLRADRDPALSGRCG
jgi:transposase-like protein